MESLTSLILFLSVSSLLLSPPAGAATPSGTIQRTTKQQVLASIPPNSDENSQPFLASPSGKYTGYLLRRETAPGAGGFGNDFCYVQVQDTSSGEGVWESKCVPVSTVNACALVFDDFGVEVFDGSKSEWGTDAQSSENNPLQTLELVDEGDMRIRDNAGELAWKASDAPRSNQHCGSPGSPGLPPAIPPFADPIGGGRHLPFGQPSSSGGQQQPQPQPQPQADSEDDPQQPLNGVSQTFGFNSQPLVDNTPFDSGCARGVEAWRGVGLALLTMVLFF